MEKIEERNIVCPQCGANGFEPYETNKVKCTHCGTIVDLSLDLTDDISDHLDIKDGGDVKITDGANVHIKGGVTVKGGKLVITGGGSLVIGGSEERKDKEEINEDNKKQ